MRHLVGHRGADQRDGDGGANEGGGTFLVGHAVRLGVEGIGVEDGQHLLIADTPQDFANAVLRLLADPHGQQSQTLWRNARKFVEKQYGWEQIVPKFDEIYAKIMRKA